MSSRTNVNEICCVDLQTELSAIRYFLVTKSSENPFSYGQISVVFLSAKQFFASQTQGSCAKKVFFFAFRTMMQSRARRLFSRGRTSGSFWRSQDNLLGSLVLHSGIVLQMKIIYLEFPIQKIPYRLLNTNEIELAGSKYVIIFSRYIT